MAQQSDADRWRVIARPDFGLAAVISEAISGAMGIGRSIRLLRRAPSLFMFSDYGGAHKGARREVYSYLVTTPFGISRFDVERGQLRQAGLGPVRRMSYKALSDNVRLQSLPAYLGAADRIVGLLISVALDKRAIHRLTESYKAETAFGDLGTWAAKPFGKLTRVGHLAAIIIEGVRADGQNLLWITDEDEIAPNITKHAEATRLIEHLLNHYCTGDMGHIRFGTTASDTGDLLIEDLAAVPDLAAGGLNEVLTRVGMDLDSEWPERVIAAIGGSVPPRIRNIANWLAGSSQTLAKVNIAIDEGHGGCWVRRIAIDTVPTGLWIPG